MKYEVARKTIFDGFPLKDAHFLKFWVDLLESFLHLFHWMWKFGGWIEAAIGESVFSATNVGRGLGSGEQATYYQEQKPRRGATGQLRTLTPISVVHWEFFFKGGGAKEPTVFLRRNAFGNFGKTYMGQCKSFIYNREYVYIHLQSVDFPLSLRFIGLMDANFRNVCHLQKRRCGR